jgi:hypothetical protein
MIVFGMRCWRRVSIILQDAIYDCTFFFLSFSGNAVIIGFIYYIIYAGLFVLKGMAGVVTKNYVCESGGSSYI